MHQIHAKYSVSITEFKKKPSAMLHNSGGEPVAILNNNKPEAYIVSAETYEKMLNLIEDLELGQIIKERLKDKHKAREVSLDKL